MKLAKIPATLGLVALAVMATSAAAADVDGPYIGGNLGWAAADIDDGSISDYLAQSGLTMTSIDEDERGIGVKLFGGYRFNRHFALEGGFFDLDEVGFTARTSPPGSLTGKMALQGVNLDPVFIWPLNRKLSALARIGVNYAEADTTYTATGSVSAPPDREKRTANYKFGAGLQYDFSEPFSMRAEVERYRIDDAVGNDGDMDLFSLGLIYHFRSAPVRKPPVLIVVPARVRTEQYCSILDIEFEINLVEIQREEKERLAVVSTFLKKYPDSTAVIEGHTDDVGSDEDNMSLSQRRAESVVSYLVSEYRIEPSRLQAVGYGESRPLVENDTEEGKRMNRRIGAVIACATDIEGLTVIPARITMAMEMEFELNMAEVRPQYREQLRKVANFLKANPTVTATVEGHTANLQGTPEQGVELSQQRAQSVVNYLVDNFATPRAQLDAEGFGKTRRFAYNTTAEGQQENRRVNIILNYPRR
jgi:OOP family OmpA-OmpF porin